MVAIAIVFFNQTDPLWKLIEHFAAFSNPFVGLGRVHSVMPAFIGSNWATGDKIQFFQDKPWYFVCDIGYYLGIDFIHLIETILFQSDKADLVLRLRVTTNGTQFIRINIILEKPSKGLF